MTVTAAPQSSTLPAIAAILAISAAATLFLFWLIYIHPAAATSEQYAFLPALNAILNGLAAISLLIGYTFIRSRKIRQHRAAMLTAFGFSTLFLVSYILHHALHGDVRYPVHAALRSVYLPLLASHTQPPADRGRPAAAGTPSGSQSDFNTVQYRCNAI